MNLRCGDTMRLMIRTAANLFSIGAVLATLTVTSVAAAGELKLLEVEAETDPGMLSTLTLFTDEQGDVTRMLYQSELQEDVTYKLEDLRTERVLVVRGEHEVAFLKLGEDFQPHVGGAIRMKYLYDGSKGMDDPDRYRYFDMQLVRTNRPGAEWALQQDTQSGLREFNFLYMRKHERTFALVIKKVVGIKSVLPSLR